MDCHQGACIPIVGPHAPINSTNTRQSDNCHKSGIAKGSDLGRMM